MTMKQTVIVYVGACLIAAPFTYVWGKYLAPALCSYLGITH